MAKFQTGNDIDVSLRSSQKTVELLQTITPADIAQSVPFLKITRIDPQTSEPMGGVPILNAFFQKPPEFGMPAGDRRYGERPPVSIEKFVVRTKQNLGVIIHEEVELDIVAHRPGAIFNDDDSVWNSILVPGALHFAEYGWAGTSKNDLINGSGFDDEGTTGNLRVLVPSRKTILFETYYYTFSIKQTGEIVIKVKAYNIGDYMLRRMRLSETDLLESDVPGQLPRRVERDSNTDHEIRGAIQAALNDKKSFNPKKYKKSKETAKLSDILDIFAANTISRTARAWGYDDVELVIGNFNPLTPTTTKKYGAKKVSSIGDFEIPLFDVMNIISKFVRRGSSPGLRAIMTQFFSVCNRQDAWKASVISLGEKSFTSLKPNVMVRIGDKNVKGKKIMRIAIFDNNKEFTRFIEVGTSKIDATTLTKEKVRKLMANANVPMIEFGNALSFIKDANFEVLLDNQLQAQLIEAAHLKSKSREEIVSKTDAEARKDLPDKFHYIWSSALKGNVTMLGNFAFDVFSYLWLDFDTPIWNGAFVIRQREDVITSGGFETVMELYSEGGDPMGVRKSRDLRTEAKKKEDERAKRKRARRKKK